MRQYRKDLPVVTILLVAANFLIFVILELIGSTNDISFMYEHGALYAPAVLENKEYYRLITAAFLHFGSSHLMNNMLGLYLIGERLERMVGKIRYLLIYFISAVGANIVSLFYYSVKNPFVISAGASGALMGIIGGFFARFVRNRKSMEGISRERMALFVLLSLYSGFATESTNNVAHISGFVFGFLLGVI
ncbi:MAG: rhomboid family intramembrane serine protease [Clostridiales bacterium]|nr:rhomboid family intramembrane serine protease [Clostridiales bacterium]